MPYSSSRLWLRAVLRTMKMAVASIVAPRLATVAAPAKKVVKNDPQREKMAEKPTRMVKQVAASAAQ